MKTANRTEQEVARGSSRKMNTKGRFVVKWDLKNLEIRTRSVEKALEPLVVQVTTLVNSSSPNKKRKGKGKSKRAKVLVEAVINATERFILMGNQIARENKDVTDELLEVVNDILKAGDRMSSTAHAFAADPCTTSTRENMIRSARGLLAAVTRLLILADMIDVHLLLKSLTTVETDLNNIRNVSTDEELAKNLKTFRQNASELMKKAGKRQRDLNDPQMRDDLAAARAVLKKFTPILFTATKAHVHHPESTAAKANRDYAARHIAEAIDTMNEIANGNRPQGGQTLYDGPGELVDALHSLDEQIRNVPLPYNQVRSRPLLEEQLESIVSGAALIADSTLIRDERREKIVSEINNVRQALQDLLDGYTALGGSLEHNDKVKRAIKHMETQTNELKRQVRKAAVDHVADNFIDTNLPLMKLIKAAEIGDADLVHEYAVEFAAHAEKLVEVAKLSCSVSDNEDGIRMVRYAAAKVEDMYPEVINAARILTLHPASKTAQMNMEAFRQAWVNRIHVLTDAVDDITPIDDFLAISENQILEDVNRCVEALKEGNSNKLELSIDSINGRSNRVCDVVTSEMDNYEPCLYTKRVLECVKVLNDEVMPKFGDRAAATVTTLSNGPIIEPEENEFIDASRLIYTNVREIRRAVLMNREEEDLDPEYVEINQAGTTTDTTRVDVDEYPDIKGINSASDALNKLPEADKKKILEHVEIFESEKNIFDREVGKWGDNDIIVVAKQMGEIMTQMTAFARGQGLLKTTMDIIEAAKKISELGSKLNKLATQIANRCPESSTKKDLLAYVERIALYCHQMNITAKVKTEVETYGGELVISGLDSATSLIQAAKNLMNTVVLTIEASYVASTKYSRQGTLSSPIVVWKMKVPEKKPLVRRENPNEYKAKIRKGAPKKVLHPLFRLSEIISAEDIESQL